MLKTARSFFDNRNILEVDCPLLSASASIDAHIDLIPALYNHKETRYLHSSPEFGMKRLLAEGIGDIYQLSHVFRDGEYGVRHNPEFMMAEWYRLGFTLEQMIEETVEFIRLFLGPQTFKIKTYRQIFSEVAGIDYLNSDLSALIEYMKKENISFYPNIVKEDKDALLNLILADKIEPQLGLDGLCVLAYYPASQAALARKQWVESEEVAERFEIYYKGIELANGYHELTDPIEQRNRFKEANVFRLGLGKKELPIDENFLKALESGIPDCCGVAVGFDRLMMIRQEHSNLGKSLSWDWNQA